MKELTKKEYGELKEKYGKPIHFNDDDKCIGINQQYLNQQNNPLGPDHRRNDRKKYKRVILRKISNFRLLGFAYL